MAGFLNTLFGGDGSHPKDVAKAYYDLNRQLAIDEGSYEQQKWKELFDQNKIRANRFRPNSDKNERLLEGVSPGQAIANADEEGNAAPIFLGSSVKPQPMSELERWKRQVDGLIQSGNPVLQKEGLSMIAQYRQQANATPSDSRTSGMKEYEYAVSQGYQGTFQEWLALNPKGVNIKIGENDKPLSGTEWIVGPDGQKIPIPVGATPNQMSAMYPGATYGEQPTADEAKMEGAIASAQTELNQLEDLIITHGADISGVQGLIKEWRGGSTIAGSIANAALSVIKGPMSPQDVAALTLSLGLSNTILQAYRGAQVGPMEQILFNKQLPVPGQPPEVLMSNIKRSQQNLAMLQKLRREKRGFYGSEEHRRMLAEQAAGEGIPPPAVLPPSAQPNSTGLPPPPAGYGS